MTPKVTIITVNYNNRSGLRKTLESVSVQTCKDFEYIVVDGASSDGSVEEMFQFKDLITHPISEKDTGIYNAMNKGIALASGNYCLFLNSGDYLADSNVLERALPYLDETQFVSGNTICVSPEGEKSEWNSPKSITAYHILRSALSHQSTFIKTSLLKARPYREDLRLASDWEQELYEIVLHDASYKGIPITISVFGTDGISRTNPNLEKAEREKVLSENFSKRVQNEILGISELAKSVNRLEEGTALYKWVWFAVRFAKKTYNLICKK